MHAVILRSEPYGGEQFEYDTFDEAMAGLRRLAEQCLKDVETDGVEREIAYLGTPAEPLVEDMDD